MVINRRSLALSLIVVAILFVCLWPRRVASPTRKHAIYGWSRLEQLCVSAENYSLDYGRLPRLSKYGDSTTYNSNLVAILTATPSSITKRENPRLEVYLRVVSTNVVRNGAFVDPWGNALHIAIDEGGSRKVLVGARFIRQDLVIWSDGPNGINEFGQGDDIIAGVVVGSGQCKPPVNPVSSAPKGTTDRWLSGYRLARSRIQAAGRSSWRRLAGCAMMRL
jgi:hypothetical protein